MGATNAYSTIYVTSDQTHLNPTGAMLYAQLAVQDMIKQNILANKLNASPNLIITPNSLHFGLSYISTYSSSKFSVSGLSLVPANGNVTVTAPNGFLVGLSVDGDFSPHVNLPFSGGNLTAKDVFVRFSPEEEKEYTDSIIVSYAENAVKKLGVTGTGLAMSGGVDATVFFPLISNATPIINGPLLALDEGWTGMYLKNYASIATWPAGITAVNVQRNSIGATSNNIVDAWPAGDIDINTERYVQFAIKANTGTNVTVDSVGLYAGAAGGSGLRYRILYSKNADFSNPVTLDDRTSNVSNTMVTLSYKPMLQFNENEGFYLRFYPWYNGAATLKYLCLSSLTIKCKVSSVSGTENIPENKIEIYPNPSNGVLKINCSSEIKQVEIYKLSGQAVENFSSVNKNIFYLDMSEKINGVYIIKIITNESTFIEKFVLLK